MGCSNGQNLAGNWTLLPSLSCVLCLMPVIYSKIVNDLFIEVTIRYLHVKKKTIIVAVTEGFRLHPHYSWNKGTLGVKEHLYTLSNYIWAINCKAFGSDYFRHQLPYTLYDSVYSERNHTIKHDYQLSSTGMKIAMFTLIMERW